jgi:hypothetical protein
VNKQSSNLVAEPVEITGELSARDDLLVLRADPGDLSPSSTVNSPVRKLIPEITKCII